MTSPKSSAPLSKQILLVVVIVVVAFAGGFLVRGGGGPDSVGGEHVHGEDKVATRWTCSMHPQIILPSNDQQCPICFMDLIPLEENTSAGLAPGDLALTETAAALADVATERVTRRFVTRSVRLVGKVAADETRTRTINARVGGRLDKLYVDATGQEVTAGMKLAEIYSPELYTAQAELQAAAQAADRNRENGSLAGSGAANLRAAMARLRLWGMGEKQIRDITSGQAISDHLSVTAPVGGVVVERKATVGSYVKTGSVLYAIADLSQVWISLEAFETDVPWLRQGQAVTFTTRAFPGREFGGDILFINPVLDERTRTIEVRVAVNNIAGLLKPGMLVVGEVEAALDTDGLPVTDESISTPPLVIPASAPLLTGDRAVVYVKNVGPDGPVFSGRQVALGPRAGDFYLVVSGLMEGDEVVTRGNFKIDSALQIQAQPSMMNPTGGGVAPGHDHHGGGMDMANREEVSDVSGVAPFVAPDCFSTSLRPVVDQYFALQEALAGDDDENARRAAVGVVEALTNLDCDPSLLPTNGAEYWNLLIREMNTAASLTADAQDVAARRMAFESLSDALWLAVATFEGEADDSEFAVRRFHCPMAMDGAGAFWLQSSETTANPYYGASMLRCGSQVEVAGASTAGGN